MFSEKIALNGGSALFSHAVENPHLWSAEDPALYELKIELLDDAGHLVEVTGQKVGFRKFELKNNRMLLNGSASCSRVPTVMSSVPLRVVLWAYTPMRNCFGISSP